MAKAFSVIQIGLGSIGLEITRILTERTQSNIVGAIDIDSTKIGKDLGELAGLPANHIRVTNNLENLLKRIKADVAIVTTSSRIDEIKEQIYPLLKSNLAVITTCEELVYPWLTNTEAAREIDVMAKRNNTTILSTGVNPGFLMDFLPTLSTGICRNIDSIKIERIQDATLRRPAFQEKVGIDLSKDEFHKRINAGTIGHLGLIESIHMSSLILGSTNASIEETMAPVMSGDKITGIYQVAAAKHNGKSIIELVFKASLNEKTPCDRITVNGTPSFQLTLNPSINGDIATPAICVNAIPALLQSRPGLRNMLDMGVISCWS